MTTPITPDERAAMRERYTADLPSAWDTSVAAHGRALRAIGTSARDDVPRLLDARRADHRRGLGPVEERMSMSTNVVVSLTCSEFSGADMGLTFFVRRNFDIAKAVADARHKSNRFVVEAGVWTPWGMKVSGAKSFVRDVTYRDFNGWIWQGWDLIEEISDNHLDSDTW